MSAWGSSKVIYDTATWRFDYIYYISWLSLLYLIFTVTIQDCFIYEIDSIIKGWVRSLNNGDFHLQRVRLCLFFWLRYKTAVGWRIVWFTEKSALTTSARLFLTNHMIRLQTTLNSGWVFVIWCLFSSSKTNFAYWKQPPTYLATTHYMHYARA